MNNEKITQCKKDIESLQENLKKLEAEKVKKKYWVAAICEDRLILHLAALSSAAKERLIDTLNDNIDWISIDGSGNIGTSSLSPNQDGLKFYGGTKVIFSGGN